MSDYEIITILQVDLTEQQTQAKLDKLKSILTERDSKTVYESAWGRRKLAYSINRQRHGYYHLFYAQATEEALTELRKQAGYDEQILKIFCCGVKDLEKAYQQFEQLKANPNVHESGFLEVQQQKN